MEVKLSIKERILLFLHSLGAVSSERAREVDEIARYLQLNREEAKEALMYNARQGYVESSQGGGDRYYLSAKGVLKVCSVYT